MDFEKFIPWYLYFEHLVKVIAPIGISYQVVDPSSVLGYILVFFMSIAFYNLCEKVLEYFLKIGQ